MNRLTEGRELAESLARFLQSGNWMTWTNQPLGSVLWGHPGIVDVLAILKSYSNQAVRIYEVKRSRDDFLQDVTQGKYLKYMEHCNQLYFAAPTGVISKSEVPEGCGLISHGPSGWRSVKTAPRRGFELSPELMMSLLMKGYQNHFQEYRRLEVERLRGYNGLAAASVQFGLKVSRDIIESRQYVETANELKNQVAELAGKEFTHISDALWWLRSEVQSLLGKRKYVEEATELVDIALNLFNGRSYRVDEKLQQIAEKLREKKSV